jgi:hypothetical protein
MRLYRFYVFDLAGNLVEEEREFRANGHELAVQIAEGWRLGRSAELWQGNSQVRTWRFRATGGA